MLYERLRKVLLAHGLPAPIGLGDWNDGLVEVGSQGKGESVWTAWFLLRLINVALPYLKERGDTERMKEACRGLLFWTKRSEICLGWKMV